MAMTLLNDSSVALSLGELNKNITKVGKSLAKLSSGQRITGASVDTASFAISEKMREQLRSLDQDVQNVQNGSAMLRTAHGGIENIVEELRSLKELAIDAVNDSNTDADRAIIQKEFDKRRETIDDIATNTKYNTKPLLDGTYQRPNSEVLDNVLEYIYETYEYEYDDNGNVESVTVTKGVAGTVDDRGIYTDGVTGLFSLETTTARDKTASSVDWVNGRTVYGMSRESGGSYKEGFPEYQEATLDFSNVTRRDGEDINIPEDLHKQGFSVFCSDYTWCPSFHGFMFDANKSYGTGEKVYNSSGPVYIVGISGISEADDLADALFEGVRNAILNSPNAPERYESDGDYETIYLSGYGDQVDLTRSDSGTVSISQHYAMWIYEGYDTGAVYSEPLPPGRGEGVSIIEPSYIEQVRAIAGRDNPLTIHHGTHSNQRTNFFINDMHTKSLRGKNLTQEDLNAIQHLDGDREKQEALINLYVEAKNKTLDQASVRTQRDANLAVRIVDGALNYALDEATYIGAYLQRLDYTEANVVTMDENIMGAESTIRDADMAKEMTEYTKNNVLSQAAQAMLAQANQNLAGVLSLLQ